MSMAKEAYRDFVVEMVQMVKMVKMVELVVKEAEGVMVAQEEWPAP